MGKVNVTKYAEVKRRELSRTLRRQGRILEGNRLVEYDESAAHPDFDAACAKFRTVCGKIQALLGVERFTGSYDEIELYKDRAELKTDAGRALRDDLDLYNSLCIHEGGKIGLPPPRWFKKCWGMEP